MLDASARSSAYSVCLGCGQRRRDDACRPPIIRRISCDPKGFQQRFQFQKHGVLTPTKDIGQDPFCAVIDGMPEPAWVAFVPDERPHLIHLRLAWNGVGTDM